LIPTRDHHELSRDLELSARKPRLLKMVKNAIHSFIKTYRFRALQWSREIS